MGKVVELATGEWEETMSSGVAVVDFWAVWCGPCKQLSPILDTIAEERPEVVFARVNCDEQIVLAGAFNIQALPTLIKFKDGEVTGRLVGAYPKHEILKWLDSE